MTTGVFYPENSIRNRPVRGLIGLFLRPNVCVLPSPDLLQVEELMQRCLNPTLEGRNPGRSCVRPGGQCFHLIPTYCLPGRAEDPAGLWPSETGPGHQYKYTNLKIGAQIRILCL